MKQFLIVVCFFIYFPALANHNSTSEHSYNGRLLECSNSFGETEIESKKNAIKTSKEDVPDVYSEIQQEVKKTAESFLERTLTEREAQALLSTHYAIEFLPKTLDYLKEPEQRWLLKEAGFSKDEIELILYYELLRGPSDALVNTPQRDLIQKILAGTVSAKENNWVYTIGLGYFMGNINSGDLGRIVKSIPGDPQKIVLEMPDPETGKITETTANVNAISLPREEINHFENGDDYHVYAGSPEIGQVFTAYRSERKILSMEELSLPKNKPLEFRTEDVGQKYTKGWPEIQEQIAFGKALRHLETPPHPHKTHIEYFAIKIPLHINYIRNGIIRSKVLNVEEKQIALDRLSQLEQEAHQAVGEKAVTYVWWLKLNLNLARVISGEEPEDGSFSLYNSIAYFPVVLVLPNIAGVLGKGTLSRAFSNRIAPFGLVTKPTKDDNALLSPIGFVEHDLDHVSESLSVDIFIYSNSLNRQVRDTNAHLRFMNTLSGQERKKSEDQYFEVIHE